MAPHVCFQWMRVNRDEEMGKDRNLILFMYIYYTHFWFDVEWTCNTIDANVLFDLDARFDCHKFIFTGLLLSLNKGNFFHTHSFLWIYTFLRLVQLFLKIMTYLRRYIIDEVKHKKLLDKSKLRFPF